MLQKPLVNNLMLTVIFATLTFGLFEHFSNSGFGFSALPLRVSKLEYIILAPICSSGSFSNFSYSPGLPRVTAL